MKTKYISPQTAKELADYIDAHESIEYVSMHAKMMIAFKREYKCTMHYNQPTYNGAQLKMSIGDDDGTVKVKFK